MKIDISRDPKSKDGLNLNILFDGKPRYVCKANSIHGTINHNRHQYRDYTTGLFEIYDAKKHHLLFRQKPITTNQSVGLKAVIKQNISEIKDTVSDLPKDCIPRGFINLLYSVHPFLNSHDDIICTCIFTKKYYEADYVIMKCDEHLITTYTVDNGFHFFSTIILDDAQRIGMIIHPCVWRSKDWRVSILLDDKYRDYADSLIILTIQRSIESIVMRRDVNKIYAFSNSGVPYRQITGDEYYGSEAALKLFDQNWIPKRYPKARKAIISEHQKMYELCVDREFDEYERATKALTFSISKLSSIIDFGDSISDVLEDARARTKARAKLPIKRYIFIIIRTVILLYIIGVIIASIQAGELRLLF